MACVLGIRADVIRAASAVLVLVVLWCSAVRCEQGRWVTQPGDRPRHYFFSVDEADYATAKTVCAYLGGYLVSVNSRREKRFLLQNNPAKDEFWIGVIRNENWENLQWFDGTRVEESNWARGHPISNPKGMKHCGEKYDSFIVRSTFEDRSWKNDFRFSSYRFVCEVEDGCQSGEACAPDEQCISDNRGGYRCDRTETDYHYIKQLTYPTVASSNRTPDLSVTSHSPGLPSNKSENKKDCYAAVTMAIPALVLFVCFCLLAVFGMIIVAYKILYSKQEHENDVESDVPVTATDSLSASPVSESSAQPERSGMEPNGTSSEECNSPVNESTSLMVPNAQHSLKSVGNQELDSHYKLSSLQDSD